MKKDVLVFYEGIRTQNGDKDVISGERPGSFSEVADSVYIMYEDDAGKATVKVCGDEISVIRFKHNAATLRFRKGEKYSVEYKTPYGAFPAEIKTRYATHNKKNDGGEIHIAYTLDFGGEKSENNFNLTYKFN